MTKKKKEKSLTDKATKSLSYSQVFDILSEAVGVMEFESLLSKKYKEEVRVLLKEWESEYSKEKN